MACLVGRNRSRASGFAGGGSATIAGSGLTPAFSRLALTDMPAAMLRSPLSPFLRSAMLLDPRSLSLLAAPAVATRMAGLKLKQRLLD